MIYCPTCGAGLRFDIDTQMMTCDHCMNRFSPEKLRDNTADDAKTEQTYDSFVYVCPSCGGSLNTTDKNDAVGFCPYCGGASMIYEKMRRDWTPDTIVPFQINKEQCKKLYCDEVKKHLFVSKKFRDPTLIEGFRGIYMPYYSFQGVLDGTVRLKASGNEKDVGSYNYRTNHFDVVANARYTVTGGMTHDASIAFDDHISEHLEPYTDKGRKPFHPAFLSGFYAETGDVKSSEYGPVIWNEMAPEVVKKIGSAKEVETASPESIWVDAASQDNYLPMRVLPAERKLLPVWFMSYRRGNKITYAAVNGQTGKVAADLPLSPLRILIAAAIGAAAIFALLFIAMHILPTLPAATTLGVCSMLGFVGMYLLQHSYLSTVGNALRQKEVTPKFPLVFIVWSVIATISIILLTTDGTAQQNRATMGLMGTVAATIGICVTFFRQTKLTAQIKKINLSSDSMLTNGLLVEAKKFNVPNGILRGVMFATMLCFIPIIINGTWGVAGYYALSAVAAAELFALALMHIFFQTKVAQRKIPQFNKKGAAYDEN